MLCLRDEADLSVFSVPLADWLDVVGASDDMFQPIAQRLLAPPFVSGQDYTANLVRSEANAQQCCMVFTIGARAAAMIARSSPSFYGQQNEQHRRMIDNYCRLYSIPILTSTSVPEHSSHTSHAVLPPPPPPLPSQATSSSSTIIQHSDDHPPSPYMLHTNSLNGNSTNDQAGSVGAFFTSLSAEGMRMQALERQVREMAETSQRHYEEHMSMMQSLLAQGTADNIGQQAQPRAGQNGSSLAAAVSRLSTAIQPTLPPQATLASQQQQSSTSSSISAAHPDNKQAVSEEHTADGEDEDSAHSDSDASSSSRASYTTEQLQEKFDAFLASECVVGDASEYFVPSDELRSAFESYCGVSTNTRMFRKVLQWVEKEKKPAIKLTAVRRPGRRTHEVRLEWRGEVRSASWVYGVDLKEGRGKKGDKRTYGEKDAVQGGKVSTVSQCRDPR